MTITVGRSVSGIDYRYRDSKGDRKRDEKRPPRLCRRSHQRERRVSQEPIVQSRRRSEREPRMLLHSGTALLSLLVAPSPPGAARPRDIHPSV